MTKTLRELAAAVLAEHLAAMTPVEKVEHDDPDGSKRRAAAEKAAEAHAWKMFEQSSLYRWFPEVQWGVGDHPMYPPDSIVVYDTEERRVKETAYFLVQWREHETSTGPELAITVRTTTMNYNPRYGLIEWPEGAVLRSAADVGEYLAKWYER